MPPKKQCVIVSYSGSDTIKVPKGIDLEAPGVEYYVKWGTLYITLANGESIEVQGHADSEIINWKYPRDVRNTRRQTIRTPNMNSSARLRGFLAKYKGNNDEPSAPLPAGGGLHDSERRLQACVRVRDACATAAAGWRRCYGRGLWWCGGDGTRGAAFAQRRGKSA